MVLKKYWDIFHKTILFLILMISIWILIVYLASQYRIYGTTRSNNLGVSFSADQARFLNLDPKDVLEASMRDLKFSEYRLVSYWDKIEPEPTEYNFSDLDWQFDLAAKYHKKINLSLGLRQPRWPECHFPGWAKGKSESELTPQILNFLQAVVERYRNHPNLAFYHLENEYSLISFGECKGFTGHQRLESEFNLVKKLDAKTPIIISRSNNTWVLMLAKPKADYIGISIYSSIYEKLILKRYLKHPMPKWYYPGIAQIQLWITGQETLVHELQLEPWTKNNILSTSTEEQFQTMDFQNLINNLKIAETSQFQSIYGWGLEWWYWMKYSKNHPEFWDYFISSSNEGRI